MTASLPLFLSFLGNIKGWEWIIVLAIILLLFGGRKIPELMKGLGKGIRSFKEGVNEAKNELNDTAADKPEKK